MEDTDDKDTRRLGLVMRATDVEQLEAIAERKRTTVSAVIRAIVARALDEGTADAAA